jgi:hypothetical protein
VEAGVAAGDVVVFVGIVKHFVLFSGAIQGGGQVYRVLKVHVIVCGAVHYQKLAL